MKKLNKNNKSIMDNKKLNKKIINNLRELKRKKKKHFKKMKIQIQEGLEKV